MRYLYAIMAKHLGFGESLEKWSQNKTSIDKKEKEILGALWIYAYSQEISM